MCKPVFSLYLAIIASLGVLSGALWFQYVEGLHPCELCLYQRIPWLIVLPVAIVGILWKTNHVVWPWLLSLIFLGSTAIAVTHVGVELSWWRWGGCASTLDTSSIEALQLALLNAPVVRCDEVPWSLFGISMAGYNVLLSAGFTLYYGYEGVHRCCRQSHV